MGKESEQLEATGNVFIVAFFLGLFLGAVLMYLAHA
jgi:hypothetical protein